MHDQPQESAEAVTVPTRAPHRGIQMFGQPAQADGRVGSNARNLVQLRPRKLAQQVLHLAPTKLNVGRATSVDAGRNDAVNWRNMSA